MNDQFSIGETARLNNVTIQTLRYYDKLGIFKPYYVDPNNGYRYYHIKQFFYLDIIKYLKSIHVPLEEIKHIILNTPQDMRQFLEDQEHVIEIEFKKLEFARALLQKRKEQLNEQLEICSQNKGEIYRRNINQEKIIKVSTPCLNPSSEPGLDARKLALVLEDKGYLIDNQYGYIFDLDSYQNSAIKYNYMFTTGSNEYSFELEYPLELDMISSGEYICVAFDWSYKEKNYCYYYNLLYRHIKDNGINTDNIVYEVSLPTNYSSLKEETFLTELRVKILDV
ncbi:helix-turn-helix domain-containing protein [Lysinibacillus sp. NPDC097279]|uniref:MerR family transcriptional regulator n=1 Tax=Lysinibacillus sp. NPDC097279 TaxID=3364143 RepID=UPI00381F35E9